MVLELLDKEYSIYKFNVKHQIDTNIFNNDFMSITKTKDETSIVAISGSLENFDKKEDGWKIFKINGVLDFSLIGIISKISTILANGGISVFVISTYNTDYIMVKKNNIEEAIKIFEKNNYVIEKKMNKKPAHNRSVTASPPYGGSGYEKPQSG